MARWMAGWMDGWMAGWMDGCMDACMRAWADDIQQNERQSIIGDGMIVDGWEKR